MSLSLDYKSTLSLVESAHPMTAFGKMRQVCLILALNMVKEGSSVTIKPPVKVCSLVDIITTSDVSPQIILPLIQNLDSVTEIRNLLASRRTAEGLTFHNGYDGSIVIQSQWKVKGQKLCGPLARFGTLYTFLEENGLK